MLPPQSGKTVEIGVGGNQRASVFDGKRRVLGGGHELARRLCGFAQMPEDAHVLTPRHEGAGGRPGGELVEEREHVTETRRPSKQARVGGDARDA